MRETTIEQSDCKDSLNLLTFQLVTTETIARHCESLFRLSLGSFASLTLV